MNWVLVSICIPAYKKCGNIVIFDTWIHFATFWWKSFALVTVINVAPRSRTSTHWDKTLQKAFVRIRFCVGRRSGKNVCWCYQGYSNEFNIIRNNCVVTFRTWLCKQQWTRAHFLQTKVCVRRFYVHVGPASCCVLTHDRHKDTGRSEL